MPAQWLLIETFGPAGAAPTVIGAGTATRRMVPLRTMLRGRALIAITDAIDEARSQRGAVERVTRERRSLALPLHTYAGNLHGFWAWTGSIEESVPERPIAGAWQFNLTTDKICGSDELLDLYGVPVDQRRTERNMAEAFQRLVTNADESAALALIVKSQPGAEHAATWTVRRDDGQLRAAHFSLRAVAEIGTGGRHEVVLRGITHDIGPAESTPAAPPPIVLAQQVLAASREPGTSRGILNLRNLRLIRWVAGDEPPAGLAWEHDPADDVSHWIHPDDRPTAERMVQALVSGSAHGTLRFRTTDRAWRPIPVDARLVLLDAETTAALFTFHANQRADA